MSTKITNAMLNEKMDALLNGLTEMKSDLKKIDERVSLLEGQKKPSNPKGKPAVSAVPAVPAVSTDIKDYEPKKSKDGHYNWYSYKAKRTDYSYAVATNGKATSCYQNGKQIAKFDDIKDVYQKAKADFEATYRYTKKADR